MTGRLLPRLAVVALLLALTIPRMAQRGMFSDGLVYATIARNMGIGVGSLWAPNYTQTAWTEFYNILRSAWLSKRSRSTRSAIISSSSDSIHWWCSRCTQW